MSETRYSITPKPSRLQRRWRWFGLLSCALVVVTLPQRLEWQWLGQLLLLGLLLREWQPWRVNAIAAFTLTNGGEARVAATGALFKLSPRSRLLPHIIWLHSAEQGWQWLWQDSLDDASWRRLCRIVLKVQRGDCDDGDSTVGVDVGKRSG